MMRFFYKFSVLIFRGRALGGRSLLKIIFLAAKVGGETSGKAIKEAKEAKEEVKSYGFAENGLERWHFMALKSWLGCRFRCHKYYLLLSFVCWCNTR